jgi:hypothetical protein
MASSRSISFLPSSNANAPPRVNAPNAPPPPPPPPGGVKQQPVAPMNGDLMMELVQKRTLKKTNLLYVGVFML